LKAHKKNEIYKWLQEVSPIDALLGSAGAEGVGIRWQHGDHISPRKRLEKPTNQLSTSRTETPPQSKTHGEEKEMAGKKG
jgi:hypothetical protein